ncbi:wall-associated receptor kinase 2-like [Cocos nucifera]|uniref:Wall-associated receptor kinase 2-like n=1 Tax=Cocos nucifera TaxID=13894 RepID=A0A8K0IP23_COCNU|nr:wall-associated receptor kinase 2-like [Cocos nucifera]
MRSRTASPTKEMVWKVMLLQFLWLSSSFAAPTARLGCPADQCGVVNIPYPFGIDNCSRNGFDIFCNTTFDPPKPFLGDSNIEVVDIKLDGLLKIKHYIAQDCYDSQGNYIRGNSPTIRLGTERPYRFSDAQNKFVAIGCDTIGYLIDEGGTFSSGCNSICSNLTYVTDGTCSGIGCCEISIPKGLRTFDIQLMSFYNHTNCSSFSPCSYAFLTDKSFQFHTSNFLSYKDVEMANVTLEWVAGSKTCEDARHEEGFACIHNHTKCYNSTNGMGYRCRCAQGYQGNPYLQDGCEGAGFGFLLLSASISWLYWTLSKRRLVQLKEKFFRQNGGLLLQLQISLLGGGGDDTAMKIFTSEELQSATNNYDEDCIVGRGGSGTVYKGTLSDQRVVAIKRSKIASKGEIEQFVNEVVLLSNINHRNVVKLLGCCLETQVPLLVSEFMSNGTLSHHIHDEGHRGSLSLDNRIRIAAETAEALAYLHSSASTPIIHRDVKSTNILLDDNFTAKVSDFGTSRLVPFDRNCLTSLVRGTFGYLDPEYFFSGQFTDKSDVYSFGVVLVELLTGEKAISMTKSEENRNLAKHFIAFMKEDRLSEVLEDCIVHEGSMELVVAVAELAERCLRLNREERPTMKEVAMELEGLRTSTKHPWVRENSEEIEPLLAEPLLSELEFYGASSAVGDGESSYSGLAPFNIMR